MIITIPRLIFIKHLPSAAHWPTCSKGLFPYFFLTTILADTLIIPTLWMRTLRLREAQHFPQRASVQSGIRTKGGELLTTGQGERWGAG